MPANPIESFGTQRRRVLKLLGILSGATLAAGCGLPPKESSSVTLATEYKPEAQLPPELLKDPNFILYFLGIAGDAAILPPDALKSIITKGLSCKGSFIFPESQETWYLLRGKAEIFGTNLPSQGGWSYFVFYSPQSKKWLKIPVNSTLDQHIEEGALAMGHMIDDLNQDGFSIDDLLPPQVTKVTYNGKKYTGVISPHYGETLLAAMMEKRISAKEAEEIYELAWQRALRLFVNHGILTKDPNPGNIALNRVNGSLVVIPFDYEVTGVANVSRLNERYVSEMWQKFNTQARRFGLSFTGNVTDDISARLVRVSMNQVDGMLFEMFPNAYLSYSFPATSKQTNTIPFTDKEIMAFETRVRDFFRRNRELLSQKP